MNRVVSQQTHAEYMLQTLFYITRLVTEGDYSQISSLGLTEEQAKKIGTMPLDELHELAMTMRSHMFKVAFDARVLDAAFDMHRRKSLERQEMLAMIQAGASGANMTEFYGINKAAYTQMRSQVGFSINDIGRPQVPDEKAQRLIWSVWLQYEGLDDRSRLLAVYSATQYKIRSIWQLLTEWRQTGLAPDVLVPTKLSNRSTCSDNKVKLRAHTTENSSDDNPLIPLH
jgi:Protein of unknown function (DUF2857)